MATIIGNNNDEFLIGTADSDTIGGRGGDDVQFGEDGNDWLFGEDGFDILYGAAGGDALFGGRQNDFLSGGDGNDRLHGDSGRRTAKGSDRLNGGNGDDRLFQGDGNDALTGGEGYDGFYFKWQDPMVALAAGTGRAFASLTDFRPEEDSLYFDVAGLGSDAAGANFIDGGNGTRGGIASSFFKGAVAASNGESVMILTDQAFATGADAVTAAQNEAMGDFIVYFNTTVNAASLLFVDGANAAHSITRFTNIDSLADLQATNFTASDFIFV